MPTPKTERVRGVNDVLPETYAALAAIEERLRWRFASFGYQPMGVPILEHTELYLRKSGEELISRLYDFTYQSRRLCLRPEMTASVVRAYVDSLQEAPLPVRLCYVGPVFRYEKPGRGRDRQFTQMGLELIGATGPMADAEVIYAACKGLDALGLTGYHLAIGHVGILAEFLQSLALESRLSGFLLAQMATLRKEGVAEVTRRLAAVYPALLASEKDRPETLAGLLEGLDEAEARTVILDLLEGMTIKLDTARDAGEIADRLLTKLKRRDQSTQLRRGLAFMDELSRLVGEPRAVLAEAARLLATYGGGGRVLEQLTGLLDALGCCNLDWTRVTLDLGLSRGLQYYTGMIFEIQHGAETEERQLCGGGRYDDLVATFGGRRDTPAAGFSYGLERIYDALASEGLATGGGQRAADVLVIPISAADRGYAMRVAEELRVVGLRVEMDVRGRSVTSNFQYADKQRIPFAVVAGSNEAAAGAILLKNMATRDAEQVAVDEAARRIMGARK